MYSQREMNGDAFSEFRRRFVVFYLHFNPYILFNGFYILVFVISYVVTSHESRGLSRQKFKKMKI